VTTMNPAQNRIEHTAIVAVGRDGHWAGTRGHSKALSLLVADAGRRRCGRTTIAGRFEASCRPAAVGIAVEIAEGAFVDMRETDRSFWVLIRESVEVNACAIANG
jgi:hypothetical protein